MTVVERNQRSGGARAALAGCRRPMYPPRRPRRSPFRSACGPQLVRPGPPTAGLPCAGLRPHPQPRRRTGAAQRRRGSSCRRHGGLAQSRRPGSSSARRSSSRSTCATARCGQRGWTELAGISLDDALELPRGRAGSSCTAIDRDGTLAGPDLGLVAAAVAARPPRPRGRRRSVPGRRGRARRGGRRGSGRRPCAARQRFRFAICPTDARSIRQDSVLVSSACGGQTSGRRNRRTRPQLNDRPAVDDGRGFSVP